MKLFTYRGGVCCLCAVQSDGVVVKHKFRDDERMYICESCVGVMGEFMPVTVVDPRPGAWDCNCINIEWAQTSNKCLMCGGENVHTGDSI